MSQEQEAGEQHQEEGHPWFSYSVVLSQAGEAPHLRSGEWARGLESLAVNGLQEPDSVGTGMYEMATFLYWVELFGLSPEERKQKIINLLVLGNRVRRNVQ